MNKLYMQIGICVAAAVLCLWGIMSPPVALACGIVMALTVGAPLPERTPKVTKYLLQACVVGLGFGMNLGEVWVAGRTGFGFTVVTLVGTLSLGWLLGKAFRVGSQTSCLVSSGTAICGGSAIAAVGAVINADRKSMSVALGTVFILNAIALFVFPPIGRLLHLSQHQFGLWSAIAIHDTSSVVGAAARYGDEALRLATTVKLTRALWIVPLALGFVLVTHRKGAKISIPWFILFFVIAAAVRSVFPQGEAGYGLIKHVAKNGLALTLFLIGTGLSREAIRTVGVRAMLQGVTLWVIVSMSSLLVIWGLFRT